MKWIRERNRSDCSRMFFEKNVTRNIFRLCKNMFEFLKRDAGAVDLVEQKGSNAKRYGERNFERQTNRAQTKSDRSFQQFPKKA